MFARAIRICATDAAHLFYLKLHKYGLRFIVALVCARVCVCANVIIFILKSICFGMCMVCLFVVVARSLVCLQQNAQLNSCLINRIQLIQFIYHNDNYFFFCCRFFQYFYSVDYPKIWFVLFRLKSTQSLISYWDRVLFFHSSFSLSYEVRGT